VKELEVEIDTKRITHQQNHSQKMAKFLGDELKEVIALISGKEIDKDAKEGEEERQQLKLKRSERRDKSGRDDDVGWSSDEEAPALDDETDGSSFFLKSFFLISLDESEWWKKMRAVFEDVYEEYSDLKLVRDKFLNWKVVYPGSYAQAYVSLVIHKIFGVFVRYEMLTWNPLKDDPNFEKYEWYKLMKSFQSKYKKDDSDANLIPNIVKQVLLPRAKKYIELTMDPYSSSQTKSALSLVQVLVKYVGESAIAVREKKKT